MQHISIVEINPPYAHETGALARLITVPLPADLVDAARQEVAALDVPGLTIGDVLAVWMQRGRLEQQKQEGGR